MARTLSAKQVLTIKFDTIRLGGGWDECVGEIETTGIWFIWGNSGNGKTSAVVSLCKELSAFGKVLYNSREEGVSLTMQNTLRRYGMGELGSRFQLANMSLQELDEKISQQRSPKFVVLDSFQFMGLTYKDFRAFCEKHKNKMLIFVSRTRGRQPEGRAAISAMYDASCKIWVEGYKAFSKGRFVGTTGEMTIWDEGAKKYWSDPI
ncbi:MAG: hypothetical protein UDS46_07355 [Bacteroidales bacterium]|jgi:hypothetical protein|nr:hypothetical protein [Bacteroidales bacterium]CDC63194.1 putative uncharacterized protein [Bacteroides sp. CAG:770]DAK66582.1 MAG TPA: recA bacterial DNA recombination protein [Bacteriophage sp.]DAT53405.1 MAG TPA: recA bacterial DNA recombination protein [Caudoviricetes sp.]